MRHIAVLVETDDSWGRNVVDAIARHARAARWSLLIAPRDGQRRLRLPSRWQGDGVILCLRDAMMARHVRSFALPTVDVSITMPEEGWLARVATDDSLRAKMAFEHFRSRGFRQFACYSPPIGRYPDGRGRRFAEQAMRAGFPCDVFAPARSRQSSGWLADYERASRWLARLEKPVAVFASDPYPARQLAEVCERDGVRIPDDVALLSGDDDDLLCSVAWPQITSVELASRRIGAEACRLLTQLMTGGEVDPTPTLVAPLRVLARHSTDVSAIEDAEIALVLRTIRERAKSGIEVQDLLGEFPISRRGLELKFKRYIGRTPAEEIRRVRIEHACRMLLDSDWSIDKVAQESGFSSGASLSHTFRRLVGVTPGTYRLSASR